MKKLFYWTIMLSLIGSGVFAQEGRIKFEEYDMENGLHVILHQDNTTPIVNVAVLYHVGSKNEPKGRTGFAHFFEHLMFEGSENIERGEYMKIIAAAGGTLNANTSNDRTYYYQTLPSNQVELGLYMESERMLHAKIDSIGIATQKEVVKEEKRTGIDNRPYGTILIKLLEGAYEGTNYAWAPIGSFEDIDAATDTDFQNFYETFYVPNNATLSIAGDIDKAQVKELINKYFAEIPKGNIEIPRPTIPAPGFDGEVRENVFDNIQLPAVIYGYKMPPQDSDESYALQMLSTLLSSGQSSRFYKQLVDQDQLALQVMAIPLTLESGGLFITFGLTNMGKSPEDLENGMLTEIKKVKDELISDQELQKLKNQMENAFVSSNSTVAGIAESLADYHVYYGDANLINREIDRYMAVTKEDIMNVAKKYLVEDNSVVLYYLPKSAQQKPEDANVNKEGK